MGVLPRPHPYRLLVIVTIVLGAIFAFPAFGNAAPLAPAAKNVATLQAPPQQGPCTSGACVMVGPRLASVNSQRGALLNALTSALLGNTVNISVADWNAIGNAQIDTLEVLNALQSNLGLASTAQVLATDITLAQLIRAATDVAQADGNTALVNALNALSVPIAPLTGTIRLGNMLQTSFPDGSLSGVDLNLLGLITNSTSLFNYNNVATTPQPITVSGSVLGLGDSVASVQMYVQVIEPPIIKCGPTGTTFYSAAMRVKMNLSLLAAPIRLTVPAVGDISVQLANLSLYLDVARAQGTITTVDRLAPQVVINAQPGVTNAYIGQISDSYFFNRTTVMSNPLPAGVLTPATIGEIKLGALTTGLGASSSAIGSTTSANLIFNGLSGVYPQTQTVGTSATFINNLLTSLVNNLTYTASPNIFGLLLNTVLGLVRPLVNLVVSPILNTVLSTVADPLLETLGIGLGEADVTVLNVASNCPLDLVTTVQVSNLRPNVGDTIYYTVTVTNNGPSVASGFELDTGIPAQVRVLNPTTTSGLYDPTTQSWRTGTIPVGQSRRLVIPATINTGTAGQAGTLDNMANSYDLDTNPANNRAQQAITVNIPPVVLSDVAVVPQGSGVMIPVTGNDNDLDGTLNLNTLTITSQPSQGTIQVMPNGIIRYVAPANAIGEVSFSYRVCDNDQGCTIGTVLVTVSALGITLESFTATAVTDGVELEWVTLDEVNNIGFNLYRGTDPLAEPERLNGELIPSATPGGGQGATYTDFDGDVTSGTTYWYWLESVSVSGVADRFPPVSVTYGTPTAITLTTWDVESDSNNGAWMILLGMGCLAAAAFTLTRRR